MACTNPMLMQVVDATGFSHDLRERYRSKGWKFNLETNRGYHLVAKESRQHALEDIEEYQNMSVIEVPCGGCIQCRLDYAQQWAVRCSNEASLYQHNYFVTLTYDDEHLPYGKFKNGKTSNPTLVKKHFQNFMKTLRKRFKEEFGFVGIRFFGSGEYGDINLRPHYHIILFNCPIPDLTTEFVDKDGSIVHKNNSLGLPMFYSKLINECWQKGYIAIDDANFDTQSYVSRYILKKQKGELSKVYTEQLGVIPPFILMSNRPGIGFTYYDQHKDDFIDDPTIIIPRSRNKPLVSSLPRYYKKKLFAYDPTTRSLFEEKSKKSTLARRSVIKAANSTINKQRSITESRAESISKNYIREV